MTKKEYLEECKKLLDYFRVDYSGDTIYLTDDGNSVIMNPDTQFKEFLGYSINSVAKFVADEMGKKALWLSDYENDYEDEIQD